MNKSVKVIYMAFDMKHEIIFPNTYTIQETDSYLRSICYTYVILNKFKTLKKANKNYLYLKYFKK